MKNKRSKEQWRTGLLMHRSYMRNLNKRPEYTLQGLARKLKERDKEKQQKGNDAK